MERMEKGGYAATIFTISIALLLTPRFNHLMRPTINVTWLISIGLSGINIIDQIMVIQYVWHQAAMPIILERHV